MRCDADVLPIKVVFLLNCLQYPLKPEGAAVVTALLRIQENNRGMCNLIISQKYALLFFICQPIKIPLACTWIVNIINLFPFPFN